MGKKWDGSGIAYSIPLWSEVLRVLKPGGYVLAFGSPRTSHRMICAIEDAGFEIRDTLMWVFGSGFPKSLDVSKTIDKKLGADRKVVGEKKLWGNNAGEGAGGFSKNRFEGANGSVKYSPITEGGSEEARKYDGWGTALKPAYEPVILVRKPLEGTVADNVLKYGTGGINISECRIELDGDYKSVSNGRPSLTGLPDQYDSQTANQPSDIGRWPANFIHDGSEEITRLFPESKGQQGDVKGTEQSRTGVNVYSEYARIATPKRDEPIGSAARFFYCPKTSRADRNEGCEELEKKVLATGNQAQAQAKRGITDHKGDSGMNTVHMLTNNHPTVKPTELMRYLVRLVTPRGGLVLDHFNGSGSTGKACAIEGFDYVGIDQDPHNIEISRCRIEFINNNKDLFGNYSQQK